MTLPATISVALLLGASWHDAADARAAVLADDHLGDLHAYADHPTPVRVVLHAHDRPVVRGVPSLAPSETPTGQPLQNQKSHSSGPALDAALGHAPLGLFQVAFQSSPSEGCPVHGLAV